MKFLSDLLALLRRFTLWDLIFPEPANDYPPPPPRFLPPPQIPEYPSGGQCAVPYRVRYRVEFRRISDGQITDPSSGWDIAQPYTGPLKAYAIAQPLPGGGSIDFIIEHARGSTGLFGIAGSSMRVRKIQRGLEITFEAYIGNDPNTRQRIFEERVAHFYCEFQRLDGLPDDCGDAPPALPPDLCLPVLPPINIPLPPPLPSPPGLPVPPRDPSSPPSFRIPWERLIPPIINLNTTVNFQIQIPVKLQFNFNFNFSDGSGTGECDFPKDLFEEILKSLYQILRNQADHGELLHKILELLTNPRKEFRIIFVGELVSYNDPICFPLGLRDSDLRPIALRVIPKLPNWVGKRMRPGQPSLINPGDVGYISFISSFGGYLPPEDIRFGMSLIPIPDLSIEGFSAWINPDCLPCRFYAIYVKLK